MNTLYWAHPMEALIFLSSIPLYYKYGKAVLFRYSSKWASWMRSHSIPLSDLRNIIELVSAGVSHSVYVVGIFFLLAVKFQSFIPSFELLIQCILCVVMGCFEMALSSLICRLYIECFLFMKKDLSMQEWLSSSRSGWIQHHIQAYLHLPKKFSIFFTFLNLFCEELIFRQGFCDAFSNCSVAFRMVLSTGFFVWIQTFFMPDWKVAVFPCVGALVVGLIHSYLYCHGVHILPLALAHLSFFLFAVI